MQTTNQTPESSVNPLERRLRVSVPQDQIGAQVDAKVKKMMKTVKVPGFRPGKVPFAIVKRNYGADLHSEAVGDAVTQAFYSQVETQGLEVAGYPRFEPVENPAESTLDFTAVFEVYPEIKFGDLSQETIEKPTLEVGEAEIATTMETLRKQRINYQQVDRAATKGDRVVVDFTGRRDGEVFQGGQATDYPFIIGEGMMLPAFESHIEGLKSGESKTFDLTFPEDYFSKELAGKTVQFEISVKRVSEPVLPEINEEFARMMGIADGDVAKLRSEIEENVKREVKGRLIGKTKDLAFEALRKVTPIDIPNALLEMEIRGLMEAARKDMEQRGLKMNNFPMQPQWFTEQAKTRVALGLLLAEVVKKEKIVAADADVSEIVSEISASYEDAEQMKSWFLNNKDNRKRIEALVIENKVVEWVLAQAKVVEKPIAFEELMAQKS